MSTNFISFIGKCEKKGIIGNYEKKEKHKYKRKGFYFNFLKACLVKDF